MLAGLVADALVLLHLAFVIFVVFGGLLVLQWPRIAWLHIPATLWGCLVEVAGWVCPLTPLEISARLAGGGGSGYTGGFIEHYILPVLYPEDLTRTVQIFLGLGVLGLNGILYALVLRRRRHG